MNNRQNRIISRRLKEFSVQQLEWQAEIKSAGAPSIRSSFLFFLENTIKLWNIFSRSIHTGGNSDQIYLFCPCQTLYFFLSPHADSFTAPLLHSRNPCFINTEYLMGLIIRSFQFRSVDVKQPFRVSEVNPFTRVAEMPSGFLIGSIGCLFKKDRSHFLLAADFSCLNGYFSTFLITHCKVMR